jgi:hypothetical protein
MNSYLLTDRLPETISLLKAIRVRGTSAATAKANAILKELSVVSKEAGTELQAGIPQPPPIEEIFSGAHFGVPDWDAGTRRLQASPVDIGKWTKDLTLAEAPAITVAQPVLPAAPNPVATPESAVANAIFHVELLPAGDKRDLKIRRVGVAPVLNSSNVKRPSGAAVKVTTDPPGAELTVEGDAEQHCQSPCVLSLPPATQVIHARMDGYRTENRALEVKPGGGELAIAMEAEFGVVEFKGNQGDTPIVYDGKQVAPQVPATVRLPVGKYEIRTMQDGKILSRQDVEVTTETRNVVTVKKP